MLSYIATVAKRIAVDTPWYSKAAGAVTAALAAWIGDPLTGVIWLMLSASLVDWLLGRAVARRNGSFDRIRSIEGWQVKGGTFAVVLLMRGFEGWLIGLPEPVSIDTRCVVSAFIAAMIFVDELHSIDENIRKLGGRGVPGLARVLAWIHAVANRWMPTPPSEEQ